MLNKMLLVHLVCYASVTGLLRLAHQKSKNSLCYAVTAPAPQMPKGSKSPSLSYTSPTIVLVLLPSLYSCHSTPDPRHFPDHAEGRCARTPAPNARQWSRFSRWAMGSD